jgi:hypothetical protein
MEIKEAIEKVESVFDCHENDRACNEEDRINIQKDKDGIIELLQRGEKFEAIVKEIKYEINWHRPEREVYDSGSKGDDEYINETLDLIDRIEQKHFPKPSKDFTEKVMKAINEGEAKDD